MTSPYAQRKALMRDHLEGLVDGARPQWRGDTLHFTSQGRMFAIDAWGRKQDVRDALEFSYEPEPYKFDNDRLELRRLTTALVDRVVEANHQGYVPGFVLLQSETDFPQARERVRSKRQVNAWGFRHQLLQRPGRSEPLFDEVVLEQPELAIWAVTQNSELTTYTSPNGGIYFPGGMYFNPNEQSIDMDFFRHREDFFDYRMPPLACPECQDPPYVKDHGLCKSEQGYRSYVIDRSEPRYHKRFMVRKRIEGPFHLTTLRMDKNFLARRSTKGIGHQEYRLAVLDGPFYKNRT